MMANAMKKLKLLHHLTAASTTTSPLPPAAAAANAQQFPTPPTSPVSPQTSTIRSHYHPHSYNDVLRSARAALHTLHNGQQTVGPPPAAPQPPTTQFKPQHHQLQQQPCLLPSGFMVLTPNDPHPAICVPNSPPSSQQQFSGLLPPMNINPPIQQVQSSVPQGNRTIYSSRPPPHQNSPSASRHNSLHRHASKPRQRLTRDAVAKVSKDSRLARWERVLHYVREQRMNTLPNATPTRGEDGVAWASYCYGSTAPASPIDRKRRAEEFAEIDRRVESLDRIDRQEQDMRSLWSGGSAGTDGVDEFVWSEDESDDAVPAWEAPPAKTQQIPRYTTAAPSGLEEGIFELDDEHTLENLRPKSTPDRMDWAAADLPPLRRERELDGGLARLAGRRMSAVY